MPNTTVRVLDIKQPGNSLATWLALHHPDIFLAAFSKARQAKIAKGIGQLGRLAMLGDDSGVTFAEPALQEITFDTSDLTASLPSNWLSDATDSGAALLNSIGNSPTSQGSTVGGALSSFGTGILGALGAVGSFLSSPIGITSVKNVATGILQAQGDANTAATQQAVLAAQLGRTATNQPVAPITYQRNAAGQLVPVYASQTANGTVYSPLSSGQLSSLTPSSMSVFFHQYGMWIAAAVAGVFVVRAVASHR